MCATPETIDGFRNFHFGQFEQESVPRTVCEHIIVINVVATIPHQSPRIDSPLSFSSKLSHPLSEPSAVSTLGFFELLAVFLIVFEISNSLLYSGICLAITQY